MKDVVVIVSSFIAGLFSGHLAVILAYLVWGLIKEGFGKPKQRLDPGLVLFCVFVTALICLTAFLFEKWPLLIGAAITFAYGCPDLRWGEETAEVAKKRREPAD